MAQPPARHVESETSLDTDRALVPVPPVDHFDRVLLYLRDPDWLYAWWEVTPASMDRTAAQLLGDDVAFALRLIDVDRGQAAVEYATAPRRGTYLPVPRRGRTYAAEVGLRSGPSFVALARSEPVFVPWGEPAEEVDPRWQPRPGLYALCLPERSQASSPVPVGHHPDRREAGHGRSVEERTPSP